MIKMYTPIFREEPKLWGTSALINSEDKGLNNSPKSNINRTIARNIVRIGLPVALQSMLVDLLSLTDVVMLSSYGTESDAAVGLASKWLF